MRSSTTATVAALITLSASALLAAESSPLTARLPGNPAPDSLSVIDPTSAQAPGAIPADSTAPTNPLEPKPLPASPIQPIPAPSAPPVPPNPAPAPPLPPPAQPDNKDATDSLGSAYAAASKVAPAPSPSPVKPVVSDSLAVPTDTPSILEKPAAPVAQIAPGNALLPARPESESMHFENIAASEVVLRFAKEYRLSIILSGDGSTPISGFAQRGGTPEAMLRDIFPEPKWQVTTKPSSIVITQRAPLTFRKITTADLNPPTVSK